MKVARDLFLQLFVQAALKLAHFPTPQTRHVDVIPRTVSFIIVPIAAQVQQVQLVNQAMFFEQINRAVDGNQMDALIDLLRAFQDLIDIQVLLGIIHNLQNHAPLPRQPDTFGAQRLLQTAGSFRGIESLAGRNPVLWCCRHAAVSEGALQAS
jgi:hypothetical protein